MSRPSLFYATPTGRRPHLGYITSVQAIRLGLRSFEHKPEDFAFYMGPVQMARSMLAEQALVRGADYIVMHDDDLNVAHEGGPEKNPIESMLKTFESDPKVGVIGAVYLRESPKIPTVNMWHPEYAVGSVDVPGEQCNAVCNIPSEPFEVAGVGTGFMMIRRQVLKDVCERTAWEPFLFWPYRTQFGTHATMGEDFYFCWRAQQCGWKVLADPRIPTVHHKDSGPLKYMHDEWEAVDDHKVGAPEGARIVKINGITCIDVSGCRKADAAAAEARRKAA